MDCETLNVVCNYTSDAGVASKLEGAYKFAGTGFTGYSMFVKSAAGTSCTVNSNDVATRE